MESTPTSLNTFVLLLILCFSTGSVVPLLAGIFLKRKETLTFLSLSLAMTGAVVAIWCATEAWQQPLLEGPLSLPFKALSEQMPQIVFEYSIDKLAAFFLLLTGVLTLAVALHLFNGLENIPDRHRIAAVFNLFVLAITLTILSNTVYSFLFFQEMMTLAFAYLALYRHNTYVDHEGVTPEALEASKTAFKSYLIFEHVGIMLIAIAFLLLSVQMISAAPFLSKTNDVCNRLVKVEEHRVVQKFDNAFDFDCFHTFQFVAETSKPANPLISSLVFLFALAGFGIKAGVFPAHVWVPMVHPYSPTSIHAMMSGIALKVAGLYGMYRVFFFFLDPIQWWWGWLVLLLAGATALFGVFYALLGKDLKTALASHSVENVGIILAGIGLALVFNASSVPYRPASGAAPSQPYLYFTGLAGLAVIASLYHLVNHSIFKGLLFFSTGAIENRLGVVALGRLGGLMKRYPLTSAAFLVGAVSIAGFPPFNGFVSEWLLLQTLFAGMGLYYVNQRVTLLVGLVILLVCLAVAFSLTALAFVKIAGEALLGAPRDPQVVEKARPGEVRWPMRIVLITFSLLCLLFGLLMNPVSQRLSGVTTEVVRDYHQDRILQAGNALKLSVPQVSGEMFKIGQAEQAAAVPEAGAQRTETQKTTTYNTRLSNRMIWVLALLMAAATGLSLVTALPVRREQRWRRWPLFQTAPPWTCGINFIDRSLIGRLMQYSGAAFASLIWKPFEGRPSTPEPAGAPISPPAFDPDDPPESMPYQEFVTPRRYVPELARQGYNFLLVRLLRLSEIIGLKAQPGDIRVYLQYIFVLFIGILVYLLAQAGRGVVK